MKPYQYPKPRKSAMPPDGALVLQAEQQPEQVGLIQGMAPDSIEEWRVAKALGKLDIRFIYQYQVFGGSIRGGQIVDFVLPDYSPRGWALRVQGEYWHREEIMNMDRLNLYRLQEKFDRVVDLMASELYSDDATLAEVKEALSK